MMFRCSSRATRASSAQRFLDGRLVALRAPALQRAALLAPRPRIDDQDPAVGVGSQRRGLGRGEAVHADDRQLARLDPPPALAVGLDQRRLHVVHGFYGAAELGDAGHLLAGALEQLGNQCVHHLGALEDVGVLEQIGLVGEDLLKAQRPLLVPRPRQPERLVPGGKLDRPSSRAAAERDRKRLESDPVDVVLRLGLCQSERVDLDAVAEAPVLVVLGRHSARGREGPRAAPSPAAWRVPR